MCTAAIAIASAAMSVMQGAAARSQANAQAAAAEQNANIARMQATDAVKRGGMEEMRIRRDAALLRGRQRVIAAASRLDPDTGSMFDVQNSSMNQAALDITINEANAQREKWAHDVEAVNFMNQASAARAAGNNAFAGGLVNAGTGLMALATPSVDSIGKGIKVDAARNNYADSWNYRGFKNPNKWSTIKLTT
jgi:hypothetical protein